LLGFAESFVAWLASTGISALLGIIVAMAVNRYLRPGYLLSFSLGVLFWVFVDVINDSGDLDVNASFSGGWEQVVIVALFVIGISVFVSLDRTVFLPELDRSGSLAVPVLIALAIGVHGLGEGAAFANVAATTTSNSLVAAFGGEAAGAAYFLHKFLESMVVGAAYVVFAGKRIIGVQARAKDVGVLALAFVVPSVVAAGVGYFVAYDSTYFFAIGTGGFLYALLRLAGPAFTTQKAPGPNGTLKMAAWLIAGLLCVYAVALLHSYLPSTFS
jgi:zinc transporter ZupT